MHFISMTHKHRELKFYHKLYICSGGWPVLTPIVAFIVFSLLNENNFQIGDSFSHPFVLIFLSVVLILGGFQVYKRFKMLFVLKNGLLTQAHLFSKTISSYGDSENPRKYKYTFEFYDENNNKHQHSLKSQRQKRLEDETEEILIYLKENHKRDIILDSLPWPINKYVKKNWTIEPEVDQNTFIKRS